MEAEGVMDYQVKQSISNSLDDAITHVFNKKYELKTHQIYESNNTIGVLFTAKIAKEEFTFFAGFLEDEVYESKLIFGVLSDNRTEITDCCLSKEDSSGNRIQSLCNLKPNINFEKWIKKQIKKFVKLYKASQCGIVRWILLIELPWIPLLCEWEIFIFNIKTDYFPFLSNGTRFIIWYISFLAVLLTIGFKNRIRKTKNLPVKLNPWTWTVSYTAKVYFFLITFAPYYFKAIKYLFKFSLLSIKYLFKILLFVLKLPFTLLDAFCRLVGTSSSESNYSGDSSSSGGATYSERGRESDYNSSNRSSSYHASNRPKLYWYICKKCATRVKKCRIPSSLGCPDAGCHDWYNVGEVGENPYQCKKCGIEVETIGIPSSLGCPNGGCHDWYAL